jgi:hypothetical protein
MQMARKSWVWAYLYTDSKKDKNSKTDPNALVQCVPSLKDGSQTVLQWQMVCLIILLFSRFGVMNTRCRNHISLERAQKTIVRMDQHSHVDAGLIHRHCKQKFGAAFEEDSTSPTAASAPLATSASRDIGNAKEDDRGEEDDGEDVADFEGLAEIDLSCRSR